MFPAGDKSDSTTCSRSERARKIKNARESRELTNAERKQIPGKWVVRTCHYEEAPLSTCFSYQLSNAAEHLFVSALTDVRYARAAHRLTAGSRLVVLFTN